jgi:hypothetical protein
VCIKTGRVKINLVSGEPGALKYFYHRSLTKFMNLPNTAIKIIITPIATKITTKGSRTSFPVPNTTIETGTPII